MSQGSDLSIHQSSFFELASMLPNVAFRKCKLLMEMWCYFVKLRDVAIGHICRMSQSFCLFLGSNPLKAFKSTRLKCKLSFGWAIRMVITLFTTWGDLCWLRNNTRTKWTFPLILRNIFSFSLLSLIEFQEKYSTAIKMIHWRLLGTVYHSTLQEHQKFRTNATISVISYLLKSMGGIFPLKNLRISQRSWHIFRKLVYSLIILCFAICY